MSLELDAGSLERIIPDGSEALGATSRETLELHLQRYRFAAGMLHGGAVLDIACGVGYGSQILSAVPRVTGVIGVDIDEASIRYAMARYAGGTTTVVCADAFRFEPPQLLDNVVSLETIETAT